MEHPVPTHLRAILKAAVSSSSRNAAVRTNG